MSVPVVGMTTTAEQKTLAVLNVDELHSNPVSYIR